MKKILVIAILLVSVVSCNNKKQVKEKVVEKTEKVELMDKNETPKNALARVGDEVITEDEVEMVLKSIPEQYKDYYSSEEGKKEILKELVEQKLIKKEAEKLGLDNDKELQKELNLYKERLLINSYINKNIIKKIDVTEDELKAYYEANKENYKIPEQVNASHILILTMNLNEKEKKAAYKKAQDVFKLVKEGKDFHELAKQYSEGPSAKDGGRLGWFEKERMVKEFSDAAFSTEKGKVYDGIVETKYGYHIILTEDKKESSYIPFEEKEKELKEELLNKKRLDEYNKTLERLKKEYNIEEM
ncbi:peptidyl-prolyl cis-trans isomerase C [Hypnocyclicus thermotrophus]|uniref:peptidylprolyl isomerase n=1 Tax=Hypnocyclicus thermotrophus TaxID=1627895 RepID=A0AA46I5F8_9FUSO|nr:peptidylprolyl isomerase [Hypnocyclicus thermotrophus]TDT69839.1 peptidyl-prolyl cis-trans isomerase C [Hypnocyclicus thermotrophus]